MPFVTANDCSFRYELAGQGQDLAFIHGEIHGLEYWEHQLPELSRDHRCLAYNRRGHAGTAAKEYGFSLTNQTRDLAALIDHFGIRRPVIIAVAFGTTIAASYAIEHPDRVKGLVIVAWSEMHEAMLYFDRWERYSAQVAEILEREGREALIEFLRREGGRSIYRVIPVESPIREQCVRMFAAHPDQPGVLAGMENFAEAKPIAGAGRFVHWERPAELNRLVRDFLRSCEQEAIPWHAS